MILHYNKLIMYTSVLEVSCYFVHHVVKYLRYRKHVYEFHMCIVYQRNIAYILYVKTLNLIHRFIYTHLKRLI